MIDRIKTLQQKLLQEEIPAALITDPHNVRYLTTFTGSNGQMFVTPKQAIFLTDFRYLGIAKKILPKNVQLVHANKGLMQAVSDLLKKYRQNILYFEEKNLVYNHYRFFKKHLSKIKLKPMEGLVENIRIIKEPKEIQYIRKAQQITETIFEKIKKNLKRGQSELEIARNIEKLAYEFGADSVSFPPIVAFGANSAVPHHQPGEKKLKPGDIVLIDMGMKYHGYCSDMTRMIFTKQPSVLEKKIYDAVLLSQQKAMKQLKAGVQGKMIDKIARDILEKSGYGHTFGHSLGHGIGLEVHESPSLSPHYEEKIPENTAITVEPGLYLEKSFGVRIEDMVLVKKHKIINLTKIPRKLEDCIITIA